MPGAVETVKLQVELFEKNAEARLRALDKLAREMGNRKITLNFDEASLERWKQATAGMTDAQVNAYAKIVSAVEKTTQAQITAANKVQTEVVKAEAAKAAHLTSLMNFIDLNQSGEDLSDLGTRYKAGLSLVSLYARRDLLSDECRY